MPLLLDAAVLTGDVSDLHWRPVEARGTWEKRQVLLDNQVSRGAAGYFVYTPLRVPGCDCAVLVNRGWIAAGPQRNVAPEIALPPAKPWVRGLAAPAPASGFGVQPDDGEPLGNDLLRVQKLDAARLSRWLGVRVVPLTIQLSPDDPDGYRRDWQPPVASADRHIAYAGQWFLFALIAAGLAIKLNSRRR
jgi:surfeit locus 1 family protein